jgi:serine phosphatase RsbU (regulator of sigma subunit)
MAVLHVLKGASEGQDIRLDADCVILGRDPEDCQVVIPASAVSRKHARILREQGRFYLEDLNSRNHTFHNNEAITRTALRHKDVIRICDFVAEFLETAPDSADDDPDEPLGSTTIEVTLSRSSNVLEAQPAERLKLLLDLSSTLSRTLDLDPLLPQIVDSLLGVFKQADRGFLVLGDEDSLRLIPRVVKTRRAQDESTARFSRSIVKRCLESAQAFLSDDASSDRNLPLSQSVVDFRIRSLMCAPLCTAAGKAFGVIQLDTQDHSRKFKPDDLKLLVAAANLASVALENARLHQSRLDQERVKRDMELAREVQESFLPPQLPEVPGYAFYAHYEPAQLVGGDFYNFIPLPGGRLAVLLGDVAGKGMPAALLMAKLTGDIRYCLLTEPDPAAAVTKLNALLVRQSSAVDRFVTLAVLVLDPAAHVALAVNAGHLPALLYRRADGTAGEACPRRSGAVPPGVLDDAAYVAHEVPLGPGDSLLLYTDGVTDALNAGNEAFRQKGVYAALGRGGPFAPPAPGEQLVKAVKQHVAGHSRYDDIAVVCVGRV